MRIGLLFAAVCTAAALTACTSGTSPGVPSLGGAGSAAPAGAGHCLSAADGLNQMTGDLTAGEPGTKPQPSAGQSPPPDHGDEDRGYKPVCAGATGEARKNALHAAAECIRQHGIPTYKDPVLAADGRVYTDERSIQDAQETTVAAAAQACKDLITTAQLVPNGQAPAPPKLVQAGVKAAQCMRDNGLPDFRDPTANDHFTPGHGFGMNTGNGPSDKNDPTVHHAMEACRSAIDEEIRASSLGSLAE